MFAETIMHSQSCENPTTGQGRNIKLFIFYILFLFCFGGNLGDIDQLPSLKKLHEGSDVSMVGGFTPGLTAEAI